MKSFALHLVVVFIIGIQYHHYNQIQIFCSSTSLITPSTSVIDRKTRPHQQTQQHQAHVHEIPVPTTKTTAAAAVKYVAHDRNNSSVNTRNTLRVSSTSTSSSPSSLSSSLPSIRGNNNDGSSNNSNNNTRTNSQHYYHQPRQPRNHPQRNQQTTKTPRMIQRLVGGHLQHTTENIKSSSSDNDLTTTTQLSKIYFRRKPSQLRNTYRLNNNSSSSNSSSNNVYSNRNNYFVNTRHRNIEEEDLNNIEDLNSDAALLEDTKDFDNWDNGILRSSAGAGKENIKSKKKEESKKTLSDQVRDGKYGLIEKELFKNVPERPGIISYLSNKEVPNDNIKNLGGLNEEEIWLAEDHLLVLNGGALNDNDEQQPWEPIDDYQAPSRQIKIPPNPKVPPPFPVQLEENGPIQFIGNHKFPFVNSVFNESIPFFSGNGYLPSTETNGDNEKNIITRTRASKNSTNSKNGYFYPSPNPPWLFNNQTFANPFLNLPLPPGKGTLDNSTDYIDEDDPSLYYPPPYSFVYESNYSSPVAPGPLVPGIILPPPPNAFAKLEDKKKKPSQEVPFRQILTKISEYKPKTVVVTTLPPPITTTTPPPTTTILYTTTRPKDIVFAVTKPIKKPNRIRVHPSHEQFVPISQYVPSTTPTPSVPQTSPPEIISFIPKGSVVEGTIGKGNPIYYEYFDARKVPNNHDYYKGPEYIPPQPPMREQTPHFRPHDKVTTSHQPPRLSKSYLPTRPFNYNDYIYITPKPEIRPNGIPDSFIQSYLTKPTYKPIHDFDREIDAIRQTLQYYKSQQLQHNIIPRVPKPKAVYEYSFDATKSNRNFHSPPQIDDEPFKPMVKYSPPIDDANAFKAISLTKTDESSQYEQNYYLKTSTPNPIQKTRVGAKSYIQPIVYDTTPIPVGIQRYSASRPKINHQQSPWISVEKQIVQEIVPQSVRASHSKHRAVTGFSRNTDSYNGHHYNSPHRQNNRFYQVGPEDGFSRQINTIKAQLQPYKLREPINLENDTYVNYAPNRPPINPDAEFIHPQLLRPDYYSQQQQQQHQPPLPPINRHNQIPRLSNRLSSYQHPISLHGDTLVNYRQPLPPINPDSEFIHPQPQIITRNQPTQYRSASTIQQRIANEQSGMYYFQSPSRDIRYNRKN